MAGSGVTRLKKRELYALGSPIIAARSSLECGGVLERYLRKREELVIERPENRALFPALGDLEDGYFAPNSLARLKKLEEDDIGPKFELRACRRTFGQGCIDEGLPIETV